MTDDELRAIEERLSFEHQMCPGRICPACGVDQVEQDTGCAECLTLAELDRRPDPPLDAVRGVTAVDVLDVLALWRN